MSGQRSIKIALAGNPNSGKTTIFNVLTGMRQHVGNYPGVTIEKKVGTASFAGQEFQVVDLPGTYSLTAYSEEEVVTRDYLLREKPDVVVNVVDASNLERNLYLTVQLIELGLPVVVAFNMADVAKARGIEFDLERLSVDLHVPIVLTVGHKGRGLDDLLRQVTKTASLPVVFSRINYGGEVEAAIGGLEAILQKTQPPVTARWLAVKLVENDSSVRNKFVSDPSLLPVAADVLSQAAKVQEKIEHLNGEHAEAVIAARRYGYIAGVCQDAVKFELEGRMVLSDHIDHFLTSRYFGLPIFLVLMYLVFELTFRLGGPPTHWIGSFFGWLGTQITSHWPTSWPWWGRSLLVDGVIAGVGGVVMFLPNILLLFFAISFLEDSGYMARAAFIMDRFMQKIGLHGKSFIPLLLGFGCSVPAIMATRTLESRRDRLITMLVIPLISCGGRFPVYALIIPAFFPAAWQGEVLWLIYVVGIALAALCAKLLSRTLLKGDVGHLIIELPPYRLPTLRTALLHAWDRGWLYLRKAGTVILLIAIVLWFLTNFPRLPETEPASAGQHAALLAQSFAGQIGHALEPILKPLGFDWRIGTALLGAFVAKEVFVAQLGIVFAVGHNYGADLPAALQNSYSPLTGLCVLLFILISMPCVATVMATRLESGGWKWALLQLFGLTALAYVVTAVVYGVGSWVVF